MRTNLVLTCVVVFALCAFASAGIIGNPTAENGWSTTSAVSVVTSSGQGNTPAGAGFINTINGSGLDVATGAIHGTVKTDAMAWADGTTNPRGGTINDGTYGNRWIEYSFDQVYDLDTMDIWGYNENGRYDWSIFTLKTVAVQVSSTGGTNASEWTIVGYYNLACPTDITTGSIPVTNSIDFGGIAAKYVVITLVNGSEGTFAKGYVGIDSPCFGISEVRFYDVPEPATIAILGLGVVGLFRRK